MKQMKQFRYYDSQNINNYPILNNYWGTLTAGNLFAGHGEISHLGIQGVPGTMFYLNNSPLPITIGSTGIYELSLNGLGHIHSIRFDANLLSSIYAAGAGKRLLIDIVYEGGN